MEQNVFLKKCPFGIIFHNNKGEITDWNKAAENMLGLNLENIKGKTWQELPVTLIREDGTELPFSEHPATLALSGNKAFKNVLIGVLNPVLRDWVWIEINSAQIINTNETESKNKQLYITFSDVTEQVKTNKALSDIINNANLGTWEWNIPTGQVKTNEKWAKILGYTLEELSPISFNTWEKLSHPKDLKKSKKHLNSFLKGQDNSYQTEIRMRHKNGNWVWILGTGNIIHRSNNGDPMLMSGIHQDISARKKAEQELYLKLKFEKFIAGLSSRFIQTTDIDASIQQSFAELGSINKASRVYLFQLNLKNKTMSNTHEWCNEGVTAEINNLQNLPLSVFPWWIKKLSNKEIIDVSNVSKMPDEAKAEREILEAQHVKSILVLPVFRNNTLCSFIGFDNVENNEDWTFGNAYTLELFSNTIANALERQSNEQAMANTLANLNNFFNLHTDFVTILDEKGNFIDANNRVKNEIGIEKASNIGKSILEVYPADTIPDANNEAAKMVDELLNSDSNTLSILSKDGKQSYVETKVEDIVWNGKPALLAISKDISDLKFSEEKFSRIFQQNPDIISLTCIDTGTYVEVNQAFYDTLGYKPEEVIGKEANLLFETNANSGDSTFKIEENNRVLNNVLATIYNKNGTLLYVMLSASIIKIMDKEYYLTIAKDVTERERAKQQLILSNANLLAAKEKAEESDRLKSAFLATMNHELRTPLHHILGLSDMIPDMTDNDGVTEFANIINQSGSNLLTMIEDIFELVMFEQSKIKTRNEDVYIHDIYLELKNQLQEALSDSNKNDDISLNFEIDPTLASRKIITDKPKVIKVISILIKNAIKFTHKGEIRLAFLIDENNRLSIKLKDTGIGIRKDKQDIIFNFFRQADDSETREYEGIGIGLTIANKIASILDGEIRVVSEVGIGSEFTVSFPIRFIEPKSLDSKKEKTSYSTPNLSKYKILIAEDDNICMEMILNMLKVSRCQIIKASNGKEATEALSVTPDIDLIFMDLKMPVMDGFEATKIIRNKFPDLPIIALSAYSLHKHKNKALEAGCNEMITKPANKEILLKTIQDYLGINPKKDALKTNTSIKK